MRRRIGKAALIILLVLCNVGCDQATKRIARAQWNDGRTRSLWGGFLVVRYVENEGAFLGMGAALPKPLRTVALILLPALALAFLALSVLRGSGSDPASVVGWSFLAGGGLGNLIDRLAHGGMVGDFLNAGIGPLRTAVFNMADLAILAGCLILAFRGLKRPKNP